jgi:hypothetical protein
MGIRTDGMIDAEAIVAASRDPKSEHDYDQQTALLAKIASALDHKDARIRDLEAALEAEMKKLGEAMEAVSVLGQEVEYSRLVLNEVKKQRTYEAANRLVPGGCVSSAMETYCARLIAGRVLVNTNPLASAAIVVSEVVPARVRRQYDALEAKLKEPH